MICKTCFVYPQPTILFFQFQLMKNRKPRVRESLSGNRMTKWNNTVSITSNICCLSLHLLIERQSEHDTTNTTGEYVLHSFAVSNIYVQILFYLFILHDGKSNFPSYWRSVHRTGLNPVRVRSHWVNWRLSFFAIGTHSERNHRDQVLWPTESLCLSMPMV